MRKKLAIFLCKLARRLGQKIGRGSSLPGKIALFIDPKVLAKVKLPEYIVAITGSNGKTSTVEMINEVLTSAGYSVAYNREGSNQIDGVATLVLCNCDDNGVFEKDVLLLESDERYAKHTFKYFAPTHFVITNLYRDQMTRNGHPEYVLEDIKKAIKPSSTLILNTDDPLISTLGKVNKNEVIYFGMNDNQYVSEEYTDIYNDGYYCPICKSKMNYEYHHYAHVGKYYCNHCGYKREEPDYAITDINLNKGILILDRKNRIHLAFNSIYNAYNILAAYALCRQLKVNAKNICEALNNYLIKNGRVKNFYTGKRAGTLLISKHENSISYNQNLKYITNYEGDVSVCIVVDSISRKYFTSDTSWLWDINFSLLNAPNVKNIVLAGKYCNDLALRLEYCNVDMSKVTVRNGIDIANFFMRFKSVGHIFVLTCFSDEHKFMKEVEQV